MVRPWKKRIDTVANTRRLYLEYLAQALVNRRLENTARAGGSYLVATVEQQYVSRSAAVTMASIVPLSVWKAALTDVSGGIAHTGKPPPSPADLDRQMNENEDHLLKYRENSSNKLRPRA